MLDGEVSGLTGLMRQLLGVGVSLKQRSGINCYFLPLLRQPVEGPYDFIFPPNNRYTECGGN